MKTAIPKPSKQSIIREARDYVMIAIGMILYGRGVITLCWISIVLPFSVRIKVEVWSPFWNNWRMDYNHLHRGDVYATHGMGPACQVLNIHRGDRMKTLVSMDTKAVNGPAYINLM